MNLGSIHRTFLFSMVVVSLMTIGIIGYFWISDEYYDFRDRSADLRKHHVEKQKKIIKSEVERVLNYVDHKRNLSTQNLKKYLKRKVYEAIAIAENLDEKYSGKMKKTELREILREGLRKVRFNNGRGYYFIYDLKGNSVLHPIFPEHEGTSRWNMQGAPGDYIIRRGVDLMKKSGEGFLSWNFYRTDRSKRMSKKIGFLKYYEPLDIFIGTGEYVADYEAELKKDILKWINKIRYGENGYIFVYNFKAITLAHYKQKNLGIDRWNFQDATGMYVVRELINISRKKSGGYLKYIATLKPKTGQPSAKMGYARSVPDWKWMIGTGVYIDDIESEILRNRDALNSNIKGNIVKAIALMFISFFLIIMVARFISDRTLRNIELFTRFFKTASTKSAKIMEDSIHFEEFKVMAESANKMLDDRSAAEKELKNIQEQLIRAKKMEALGVLAGGVAHDLNNVLSGIVSYPDLILYDLPEDSKMYKRVKTIKDSGMQAAAIVQDLLTLARRGIVHKEILNMNDIIESYLSSPEFASLKESHSNVEIISDLDTGLLNIEGSSIHLKKTVMNLVTNAAEAQPDGGEIFISTRNRYIDKRIHGFETIEEGNYILLEIKDQGVGISKEDIEHIFEPFYTKKIMGKSGTGLGMAVVWGTVQDHGGVINVNSEVGKGSVFEVYLRASRESLIELSGEEDIGDISGNGEKVLVVDDIEEQREIAVSILERLNYEVAYADSGDEAVRYMKSHSVDLVILDMIMEPGIDGLETYRKIVSIHPSQKAIIASGFSENERVREAQKLGAGKYVKKPYTLVKLAKAVKEELGG